MSHPTAAMSDQLCLVNKICYQMLIELEPQNRVDPVHSNNGSLSHLHIWIHTIPVSKECDNSNCMYLIFLSVDCAHYVLGLRE